MKYRVWDSLNSEIGEAVEVEADSAREAAVRYGEEDTDGLNDGLYHDGAQAISVVVDGVVELFDVSAEMCPVFRATRVIL